MQHDVIIACDFKSAEDTFRFLDLFKDEERKPFLKIGTRPLLIAVTQLTSTSEERMREELLIDASINDTIVKYAQNTRAAGLDGVVCSPLEAGMVHGACGEEFLTVTPGVRFADGDVADQVRVTTPARAREIGSDLIVVGRPITAAEDPVAAYRRCVAEFVG